MYRWVHPNGRGVRRSAVGDEDCLWPNISLGPTEQLNPLSFEYSSCHFTILLRVKPLGFERAQQVRRSTIKVHPNFSKAPHLRSSLPHLKTDFSKKTQIASRRIILGPSLENVFFSKPRMAFRRFGLKEPVFQKQHSGNVLPLS